MFCCVFITAAEIGIAPMKHMIRMAATAGSQVRFQLPDAGRQHADLILHRVADVNLIHAVGAVIGILHGLSVDFHYLGRHTHHRGVGRHGTEHYRAGSHAGIVSHCEGA